MNIDLTAPAITEVCFSLTKGLGIGNLRTGIRYSNYDSNDSNPLDNKMITIICLGAAQIGMHMMDSSHRQNTDKYKQWQADLCEGLGLTQLYTYRNGSRYNLGQI